jgi:hypothetical protein
LEHSVVLPLWLRKTGQAKEKGALTSEAGAEGEDLKIMAIADELFSRLAAERETPKYVKWVGPSGFAPSSVEEGLPAIHADTVLLPNTLKGKMQLDEWKPLLASSIVFQYEMNVRRRVKLGAILWLSTLVLILTVPLLLNFPNGMIPVLSIVVLFIFAFYYGIYSIPRLRIGARLKADRVAAQLVGRQALVGALQKVGTLESTAQDRDKSDFYAPTISRRLRNLRSH